VVEAYIDEAQPVSSAAVSRVRPELKASPATIRSVMAELEENGLLLQPHTSAGRVPTEKGLRAYLDGMMSEKLHPWDRSRLDAAASGDPADFPAALGQVLSSLSGQLAVIAVPRFVGSRFREVGLLRCERGRFLAYFVSPGGLVQQKVVDVDFDLTLEELTQVQNYLNERLQGRTLEEVRGLVREQLDAAQSEAFMLARQALEICKRALPEPDLKLVVEGASHLVQQPEFADVDKLRTLLRTLDDRAALLRLLDRVLDGQGVRVVLGSEALREVPDLACIGSTLPGSSGSALSVVGPTRMDYGRLVPLVRYATVLFERYWTRM
jgi:heat-inducible transcriptional repressor